MSIVNLQQKIHNRQFHIYNYAMANYDADKFADWLTASFGKSSFKSFAALADSIGLSRSTISALAGAKKQPLTDKPSQPKSETVIKLAEALGEDPNQALLLAGHAPRTNTSGGQFRNYSKLSSKMKKVADKQIEAIIESLAAIDEPDTDYGDFDKETSPDAFITGVPYKN